MSKIKSNGLKSDRWHRCIRTLLNSCCRRNSHGAFLSKYGCSGRSAGWKCAVKSKSLAVYLAMQCKQQTLVRTLTFDGCISWRAESRCMPVKTQGMFKKNRDPSLQSWGELCRASRSRRFVRISWVFWRLGGWWEGAAGRCWETCCRGAGKHGRSMELSHFSTPHPLSFSGSFSRGRWAAGCHQLWFRSKGFKIRSTPKRTCSESCEGFYPHSSYSFKLNPTPPNVFNALSSGF